MKYICIIIMLIVFFKTNAQEKRTIYIDTIKIVKLKKIDNSNEIIQEVNLLKTKGNIYIYNNFPFSSIQCAKLEDDTLEYYNAYQNYIFNNSEYRLYNELNNIKYTIVNKEFNTNIFDEYYYFYNCSEFKNYKYLYSELNIIAIYFMKQCSIGNYKFCNELDIVYDLTPIIIDYKDIKKTKSINRNKNKKR